MNLHVFFHPIWMMENDGRNAFHVNWLVFMDNYCTLLILLKQTHFFWVAASIYFHPFSLISIEFNSAIATNYRDGDTLFAKRFDTMALVYYDLYIINYIYIYFLVAENYSEFHILIFPYLHHLLLAPSFFYNYHINHPSLGILDILESHLLQELQGPLPLLPLGTSALDIAIC